MPFASCWIKPGLFITTHIVGSKDSDEAVSMIAICATVKLASP